MELWGDCAGWRSRSPAALLLGACTYELRELEPDAAAQRPVVGHLRRATAPRSSPSTPRRTAPTSTLDDIPMHVRDAVIAIEDERFWLHHGVDFRAILRAVSVNAAEGEITQGGSTITQQLVKQLLLDADQTLDRKVAGGRPRLAARGALHEGADPRAVPEHDLPRQRRLRAVGGQPRVLRQAADRAHRRRGRAARRAHPGAERLRPLRRARAPAIERRNLVLDAMLDQELLDQAAYDAAVAEPLDPRARGAARSTSATPAAHFVEEVKQWILDDHRFGDTAPRAARAALHRRHPHPHDDRPRAAGRRRGGRQPDPPRSRTDPAASLVDDRAEHRPRRRAWSAGATSSVPATQAKFNLAMGRGRQTGSSFKPIVLAAALQDGIPLDRAVPGARQRSSCSAPNGSPGTSTTTARAARACRSTSSRRRCSSYNTVYAQLILRVGVERTIEMAHAMGITRPLDEVPLGGARRQRRPDARDGVGLRAPSPTAACTSTPVLVTSHRAGRRHDPLRGRRTQQHRAHGPRRGRHGDVGAAAGRRARHRAPRRSIAGRAGRRQDRHGAAWRNAWFCGYVPQLATAVWVGFPGRSSSRWSRRARRSGSPAAATRRGSGRRSCPRRWRRSSRPRSPTRRRRRRRRRSPYCDHADDRRAGGRCPTSAARRSTTPRSLLYALGLRVTAEPGRIGPTPGTVVAMSPAARLARRRLRARHPRDRAGARPPRRPDVTSVAGGPADEGSGATTADGNGTATEAATRATADPSAGSAAVAGANLDRVSRWGKVQLILVVAIAAFWIGIWTWTVTTEAHDPPDFLDDRSFPEAAEPICAARRRRGDGPGQPRLRRVRRGAGRPGRRAGRGLRGDGRRPAGPAAARRRAGRLGRASGSTTGTPTSATAPAGPSSSTTARTRPSSRPPRDNNQISETIDNFAEVNDMESCATLGDV